MGDSTPNQFRTINQDNIGSKYDSQKFKTYTENPFLSSANGSSDVKTNLKNILKLNKIKHQDTEITPRIIKTAGAGSIRQKRA